MGVCSNVAPPPPQRRHRVERFLPVTARTRPPSLTLRHPHAVMQVPSNFTQSVLQQGAVEEKGENARLSSFVGAMAIADLVKTTLGPKGMDKILQSVSNGDQVTVTNDGATILKSIYVDNPAAKVLVDISKVQDDEVGDGTTSVVVLAGELLREAEQLMQQKIHPMVIIAGFREAADIARSRLETISFDNGADKDALRNDLVNIAKTTLSSKILTSDKDHFAELAVDAVLRLKGSTDLQAIQILKKPGGTIRDSFLDEGFILDKRIGVGQPKRVENAKILVANTSMDSDKIKIYGARVKADSLAKVAEIELAEKDKMKQKCEAIIGHGVDIFINRQLIYNYPEELFADAGVMAIEHADFDGIERLALVTGGEIDVDLRRSRQYVKLGRCDLVEEMMIGDDTLIHFSGCSLGEACTVVLRGAHPRTCLDEAERSLHDALCVLSQTAADTRVIYGGGWAEVAAVGRHRSRRRARGLQEVPLHVGVRPGAPTHTLRSSPTMPASTLPRSSPRCARPTRQTRPRPSAWTSSREERGRHEGARHLRELQGQVDRPGVRQRRRRDDPDGSTTSSAALRGRGTTCELESVSI